MSFDAQLKTLIEARNILIVLASKSVFNFASKLTLTYFVLQIFRVVEVMYADSADHVTAVFENCYSKDHILIKNLSLLKGYIAQELLKEFPCMS